MNSKLDSVIAAAAADLLWDIGTALAHLSLSQRLRLRATQYSRDAIFTLRTDDIENSSGLTDAFLHLVTLRCIGPP